MQACVEVSEERVHLLLSETPGEGRHFAFAAEDGSNDLSVRGRGAAGKFGAMKEIVEAGWRRLEGEVVFLMTVGAALLVEMLASCLLWRELRL